MTAETRDFEGKEDAEKAAVHKTVEGVMSRSLCPSTSLSKKLLNMKMDETVAVQFKTYLKL